MMRFDRRAGGSQRRDRHVSIGYLSAIRRIGSEWRSPTPGPVLNWHANQRQPVPGHRWQTVISERAWPEPDSVMVLADFSL
jgi:hypothetical protein